MKKIILQMLLVIASIGFPQAQIKITGKITDAQGKPLDYVSITVKEVPSAGTFTDIGGNYTINVPSGGTTLVFSFVGYKTQEELIGSRSIINVTLVTDATTLEGSVVTALGIKRSEKSVSYAVTQMDNEELTKAAATSPLNALQGKIAGVNIASSSGAPGASTRVILRGYSSIGGNNQPLVVVDGVPVSNSATQSTSLNGGFDFGNGLNDINPNDIESVSTLKGASASALYGSRAANGVIMITTKKGAAKDNLSIDITSNTTFSRVGRLPEMQNTFGQGWSGQFSFEENGSWGPKFDGVERPWGNIVDGEQLSKPYSAQKNNLRDFFDTEITSDNTFAIHGGTENATYYASYSNVYEDGVLPTDKDVYQRNAFSLKGSVKGKIFTSSASVNYSNKYVSQAGSGQGYTVYNNLMQIPRDFSIVDMKDYNNKFYNIDNYYTSYGIVNPYYTLEEYGNTGNDDHLFGHFQVDANILSWLTATARVGEDFTSSRAKIWEPVFEATPGSPNAGGTSNPGYIEEYTGMRSELSGDFILTFKPKLNDDFSLNGILGYNINMRYAKSQSMNVTGLIIPGFYHISNSTSSPSVSSLTYKRRLMGVFAQADLAYKNYLYLNVSARNDWSSTLPIEKKSFFYPSVGVSFLFTDAFSALKDSKIISYGKLRANYGVTGNDPTEYLLKNTYTSEDISYPFGRISFPFGGLRGYGPGASIANPNLKPELTSEIEFGLDVRFLDNKLGLDISWYKRNSKNQILAVPIANTSGYRYQLDNLGNVQNKGWEVVFTANPVRTSDWNWNFTYTFTRNRNMVIELSDLLDQVSLGGLTSMGFYAKEGMALGYFTGRVPERDPDGNIVVDSKGIPVALAEHEIIGESQGDYQMGFSNNISYKGLHFSFSVDIRKGGLMFSRTADINYFVGNAPQTAYNDRNPFIVPNSVQKIPDYDAEGNQIYVYVPNTTPIASEDMCTYWNNGGINLDKSFLLSKTMVALREVVIGYTLPAKWFNNKFVKGIDINFVGNNLLLWT
ncbi:MAG: SusC/RagA family TonB-linked outer membrane protein, partial [Prevotellaceae bacterium]|nr:SusC/RagA family TonB-linked outer membrane protein [Prevotellaceae bacterium]